MESRGDVLSVVKEYLAGWNAHDVARAARCLADDVEYFDASVGEPQRGMEAARDNVIRFFLEALPDLTWTMIDEPLVSDGSAAFRWIFAGKNTGRPFEGDAPTGASIELRGMSLVKVLRGKIVYQGDFYDALTLRRQLGLPG